jgi:CRP-like cAMP-binding protein
MSTIATMFSRPPSIPAALKEKCTRVRCDVGQTVFRSGAAANAVYYIELGAVRLVHYGRAGEAVVLHDARPGEFFCTGVAGHQSLPLRRLRA